jgi:hypothetical protein
MIAKQYFTRLSFLGVLFCLCPFSSMAATMEMSCALLTADGPKSFQATMSYDFYRPISLPGNPIKAYEVTDISVTGSAPVSVPDFLTGTFSRSVRSEGDSAYEEIRTVDLDGKDSRKIHVHVISRDVFRLGVRSEHSGNGYWEQDSDGTNQSLIITCDFSPDALHAESNAVAGISMERIITGTGSSSLYSTSPLDCEQLVDDATLVSRAEANADSDAGKQCIGAIANRTGDYRLSAFGKVWGSICVVQATASYSCER